MSAVQYDVAILGSGFGGCLSALVLNRIGLKVVVIDRTVHPRFAIGESSTPIANSVLRQLARRYDLPRLKPLSRFGTWQQSHPEIVCGIKRGFCYFKHEPGQLFRPHGDHRNELFVAASADEPQSDTHWLRADVDAFFASEVRSAGIPLHENTMINELVCGENWSISGHCAEQPFNARADFVVDATGSGGLLAKTLPIADESLRIATNSRANYSHFVGVKPWHDLLAAAGGRVVDHPFPADHAAQHHIFDGGWMWNLRFQNGVVSAGFVLDNQRHPLDESISAEDEWKALLHRYPSLAEQFAGATLAPQPGRIVRTRRLQRLTSRVAGVNWAMLPHTVGFIDPLHSAGIAHTMCGVERLVDILAKSWSDKERLARELTEYQRVIRSELTFIDRLVHACYASMPDFSLLTSATMLYFAAATTFERRATSGLEPREAFLCAEDATMRQFVDGAAERLQSLVTGRSDDGIAEFDHWLIEAIEPFNRVGLCDPSARNMYRYTAAPPE